VLLTHRKNSSASNWDLARKKEKYFVKGDKCPFILTGEVLEETIWTPETLAVRQWHIMRTLTNSWNREDAYVAWQKAPARDD
jgi:hypothetical protein